MASAILARRNELHWAETKVYMRKPHPNSKPSLNKPGRIPNPNPNPKPNLATAAGDHATDCYEMPPSTATVSDYSSSINPTAAGPDHMLDFGGFVTFNISAFSKKELRDLKRRFESELEKVRAVVNRIESGEFQSSVRSVGHSASGVYGGLGGREVTSSTGLHHPATIRADGFLVKPAAQRAGQYNHQLPAVSTGKVKKAFGGCRLVAPARGPKQLVAVPEFDKALAGIMSKCRQILTKLMKNKGSIWFNNPVDVEGMKLHDYNTIIKNPMDLGTVRTKLAKGEYSSPLEFAGDVRLTFNNALIYNPAGHVVHVLAGQLLRLFEDNFCQAYEKFKKQQNGIEKAEVERRRCTNWSRSPLHDNAMKAANVPAISPRHSAPPLAPSPLPVPSTVREKQQQAIVGRLVMGTLPKPKAKEPNKRPMSSEEKKKLSVDLQSLPQEKMDQVLQIVSKRNGGLVRHGNEIELDFQAMGTETLWELDRFVGNCKKMMSKIKRQEAMVTNMISAPSASAPAEAGDKSPVAGEMPDETALKKIKKADPGDEDVDIGEETHVNYPSVVIEKDNAGYASSSDSDSSSSSGSSGSDSDSSSGSDSDDDPQLS